MHRFCLQVTHSHAPPCANSRPPTTTARPPVRPQHCAEDLRFFDAQVEKGLLGRLADVVDKPFATVTYTEAIKLLLASGRDFENPVSWGIDLSSEHER